MAADVSLVFIILITLSCHLTFSSKDHILKVVTGPTFLEGNLYFEITEPQDISYTFKIRPAKNFGPILNTTLHDVLLMPVQPPDGCSELSDTNDYVGAIALIERGGCSFLGKTLQAQKAGAMAAIIMDNDLENDQRMIDMIGDDTNRNTDIPAFFLLGKDGHMIRRTLERLHLSSASINIPINVSSVHDHKLNRPPWSLW